jgi:hypothetical protein
MPGLRKAGGGGGGSRVLDLGGTRLSRVQLLVGLLTKNIAHGLDLNHGIPCSLDNDDEVDAIAPDLAMAVNSGGRRGWRRRQGVGLPTAVQRLGRSDSS